MSRNEAQTCHDVIEPALKDAGWEWDPQVLIGRGRVNITGEKMYDPSQSLIADYLLRLHQMPLAVLEAKAEIYDAADGMQQGSRYAERLKLRFSIATNGRDYILTDNQTNHYETLDHVPTPGDILSRQGKNVVPRAWRGAFTAGWHVDQVTRKEVRAFQQMAIYAALYAFSQDERRALLLMATGTGKTFTVFQLVWKLLQSDVLPRRHVLFLTDRNSLKDQAYLAFAGFSSDERVVIDKELVQKREHTIGKVFFANYQNLDEELDGKKLYEHFEPDFFDLVIVDECHRSGFGDWFGVLEHFGGAYQLGLTATPRDLDEDGRPLTTEEKRRDTYSYFGAPVFTYSLREAIDDGYLVPYLLEERVTNVDQDGYDGPDGKHYTTSNFERDIRMTDRTKAIAEDLWHLLGKYDLRQEKSIVFCVDDTHAAYFAAELRRLSGDANYAARITRSERNSHQLERRFSEVGPAKPRVAVTVDLLTTGFDAPDVKNIVFARPVKSPILYKQMKGRGTRLCENIDKRYFTIFDYAGASACEDAEWDGHPANKQKGHLPTKPKKASQTEGPPKVVAQGVTVSIVASERYVCLADGSKTPFDEYCARSREVIRTIAKPSVKELLRIWIDKSARNDLRSELQDQDVYVAAFRHFLEMDDEDDVDVLAKVGFDLALVPTRRDRVGRFWSDDGDWLRGRVGELALDDEARFKTRFWETSLAHYQLFGIDDLEQGQTYSAPQFVERFGGFAQLLGRYGGAQALRVDLEEVKQHLYVPMAA
jgi:type I restriction enzyme R subunit